MSLGAPVMRPTHQAGYCRAEFSPGVRRRPLFRSAGQWKAMRLQARRRGPAAAFARKSPAVRVPLRWSIGSRAPRAAHRRRTRTTARPQTLLETPIDANTRLAARMGDIPTDEGRSFLVVVIGLLSRQWAAWSLRADMMCDIVIDARRVV